MITDSTVVRIFLVPCLGAKTPQDAAGQGTRRQNATFVEACGCTLRQSASRGLVFVLGTRGLVTVEFFN